MKITKLLSLESRPAQTLLARAKKVVLSYADRVKTPAELTIDGVVYENALGDVRPLEVDDVLVDEKGAMYVVAAGEDKVMHVTGDHELMQEAVYAFRCWKVWVLTAPSWTNPSCRCRCPVLMRAAAVAGAAIITIMTKAAAAVVTTTNTIIMMGKTVVPAVAAVIITTIMTKNAAAVATITNIITMMRKRVAPAVAAAITIMIMKKNAVAVTNIDRFAVR